MEVLQMAQAALEQRIEQELASNPTLELAEAGTLDLEDLRQERQQERRDDTEAQREMVVSDNGEARGNVDDFERLSNLSDDYGEQWTANTAESAPASGSESSPGSPGSPGPPDPGRLGSSRSRSSGGGGGERDAKMDAMANAAARGASLADQLLDQWRLVDAPPDRRAIGELLIDQIDADGYFRGELSDVLPEAPAGSDEDDVEAALLLLQRTIEPPGIGARSLGECLLLQMDAAERADRDEDFSDQRTLIEDHLKDIEANRYPKIAKAMGMDIADVQQAVMRLRRFHPHPGRLLADEPVRTVTPDAVIEYDEDADAYTVELTNGMLPAIQISREYEAMAKDKQVDTQTRDFVGRQLRSASWLVDAIRQRNQTLLRVIRVVVEAQRDYFEQGESALKPLPMTLVADQLGVHVATVSRAVSEKYLQTPRGIVPLRMFFSGGTQTDEGEAMSWTAVQAKLKQVIDDEDKSKPLSDDALVEQLGKQGIEIARRTVAKYRKQLGVPTARQRKEY
jgi:RNA polymerase sigma-54 factor